MSAPAIHSSAIVEDGAEIGDGCRIGPFCHVGPQVVLGVDCELVSHAVVAGDTRIGARTKIQAEAYVTAYSTVEEDVFIAPCVVTTNDDFMGRTERRHELMAGPTIRRGARVGGGHRIAGQLVDAVHRRHLERGPPMLPGAARCRVRVEDDVRQPLPGQVVRRGQAGLAGADDERVEDLHTR